MSDHKEYPPDLQAAVDERGHDHEAPICTSCGKPFSDHMGIVGTCAKLKELEESLADADAKAERIERDALKAALREAATSLRTIADGAGTNYGIETMFNVRGFANSRSVVAERALDGVK